MKKNYATVSTRQNLVNIKHHFATMNTNLIKKIIKNETKTEKNIFFERKN